jgi:predicted aspartyl protease
MRSLADALPPEIARQVHPDWRKNEAAYWAVRDQLLGQYRGRWIGFADGAVMADAATPLEVFLAVHHSGRHPFVVRVGHEHEPWYRIRRASFAYDTAYPSTALPVVSAEFRATSGSAGVLLDRVIPDTGADTTTLPWPDCQQLRLDPALGVPGVISGVAGGVAVTMGFLIWVWLDGQEYPCQLQADFAGRERILGRDVLNRLEILFRGPAGEVIVNP